MKKAIGSAELFPTGSLRTCHRFQGYMSAFASSGDRRSSSITTCGPDESERLLMSARSVAFAASWTSAKRSTRELPTGVPGTFSKDVMKYGWGWGGGGGGCGLITVLPPLA